MQSRTSQPSYFIHVLIAICCFYLGFEIFYNYYATLSVDEFWFAHNTYAFKDKLPYRDFAPYKTVLGYYLLLPLLTQQGILSSLIFAKNILACVNTLILFASSLWLSRFFSRGSIVASLLLIATSEVVLAYSTNFRVDMLGYWFGFFAFICLIENRYLLAGLLMGLGFATTQKIIWYVAAGNSALGLYWLFYQRDWAGIKNMARFNLSLLAAICAYVLFWSLLAGWHSVINSVFYEALVMYKLDWYDSARLLFWKTLTLNNPLLFLLWPLTLLSICVTYDGDRALRQRFMIVIFSIIIFFCLIPYKQVFPYYMQVAIPALFVLYTAFFSWLCGIFANQGSLTLRIPKLVVGLFSIGYIAGIIWFCILFELPTAYLLICLVPMLLGAYVVFAQQISDSTRVLLLNIVCGAIIIVNGIFPLMLFCIKMVDLNGGYQKDNIALIDSLLQDGSDYLAGIELIYNKTQPIAGMRHLMGPALDYLHDPTAKLRAVMLPSLNEDPNVTLDSVVRAIKDSNVKFYVNNYRMMEVPEKIRTILDDQYEHFWGSIYLYAPRVRRNQANIQIKFPGKYQIESKRCKSVLINGKRYARNSCVYLNKGKYSSRSKFNYRLKLLPQGLPFSQQDYQPDRWGKMLS